MRYRRFVYGWKKMSLPKEKLDYMLTKLEELRTACLTAQGCIEEGTGPLNDLEDQGQRWAAELMVEIHSNHKPLGILEQNVRKKWVPLIKKHFPETP